jgi:hypothetical protein
VSRPGYAAVVLLLLLGTAAVRADDAADESANEIVVFGGVAILDASRVEERTIGPLEFARFPDFARFPEIRIATETSIGKSALFGARYSRYVKERLAVELDFAVAPTHDLRTQGELCIGGQCILEGDRRGRFANVEIPGLADGRQQGDVTAWHYGAGLAYDLAGGELRPVLIAGAGGVSWSGAGDTETDFVVRFGAGLKILFGRVGARVDVVDHLVLDHFLSEETEHDIHATAGLLVRF